jgi:hypothetical protein
MRDVRNPVREDAGTSGATGPDELLPLPGGPLLVWPAAVLRGAGFPIGELVALGDPVYAAAVDADSADPETVARAEGRQHDRLVAVAARPDLQTAVAWQNPAVLREAVRPLARGDSGRRNQYVRRKERVVTRYWARYCAKNDTIGFFGPVCWADLRPDGPFASVAPGSALVGRRSVHLEPWAVDELAAVFSADPAVRPWIAPRRNPSATLVEREFWVTEGPPVALTEPQWRVLSRCDGLRPARDLVAELVAGGAFPDERAAYRQLGELVEAGYVRWDLEPPMVLHPELVLRTAVSAIGDEAVRAGLDSALDRLESGVAAVARAAGVDELDAALAALDETFGALTAKSPRRRPGETYGGRRLVYLEASREAEVSFGPQLLDRLGPPLSLLAYSLRWLTGEIAARYEAAFNRAYDVFVDSGTERVALSYVVGMCAQELFVPGSQLFQPVLGTFARQWGELLGVDRDVAEVRHSSAELWPAVRELFPSTGPGWMQAYQHSADVQVAAPDPAALARGEGHLILGELHAAWNTIEAGAFVDQHPDPARLSRMLARSMPGSRVLLVPVKHYPRVLARTMPTVPDDRQWWLALSHYPGGDPRRRTNLAELTVERDAGGLYCRTPDGRGRFRPIDVLGMILAAEVLDAFKLPGGDRAHLPRIWVDDLVVTRESWTVPLAGFELPRHPATELAGFQMIRRAAARLGLPRFVFVKLPGELKPFYVDLTSSAQAAALVSAIRRARETEEQDSRVRFTEMLPAPDQVWLPGPNGERYTSELRLQVVDPGTDW